MWRITIKCCFPLTSACYWSSEQDARGRGWQSKYAIYVELGFQVAIHLVKPVSYCSHDTIIEFLDKRKRGRQLSFLCCYCLSGHAMLCFLTVCTYNMQCSSL